MQAIHIEFTPPEIRVLKQALDSYLSNLRMEIVDTDSMDFREGLKDEKHLLESVLTKLDSV